MSRMFSNARYVSILAALVVEGASEASGALAITAFSADYQSADLAHAALNRVARSINAGAPLR